MFVTNAIVIAINHFHICLNVLCVLLISMPNVRTDKVIHTKKEIETYTGASELITLIKEWVCVYCVCVYTRERELLCHDISIRNLHSILFKAFRKAFKCKKRK